MAELGLGSWEADTTLVVACSLLFGLTTSAVWFMGKHRWSSRAQDRCRQSSGACCACNRAGGRLDCSESDSCGYRGSLKSEMGDAFSHEKARRVEPGGLRRSWEEGSVTRTFKLI